MGAPTAAATIRPKTTAAQRGALSTRTSVPAREVGGEGGEEGGEPGVLGHDLGNGALGEGVEDLVQQVDHAVVRLDVGLGQPLAVHGVEALKTTFEVQAVEVNI